MIVTGHQADLFPYSGFWYKMAKADLFDLKIYDQFQARGYQRRVMMRETWASVPIIACSSRAAINEVRIDPVEAPRVLSNLVRGRYQSSRNWKRLGPVVLDMINDVHTDHLWQLNLSLILGIRDLLDIATPIAIARPAVGRGSAGLASVMQQYKATTYLSGTGGRAYMGAHEEFDEAGIGVEWSRHRAVSGDSVLTLLMDFDDPMDVINTEHEVHEEIYA